MLYLRARGFCDETKNEAKQATEDCQDHEKDASFAAQLGASTARFKVGMCDCHFLESKSATTDHAASRRKTSFVGNLMSFSMTKENCLEQRLL